MATLKLAANYITETDTFLLPPGLRDSGHLQIVFDDGDPATRLVEAEVNAPALLVAGDWEYMRFGRPHGAPTPYISADDVVEDADRYRSVELVLKPFQSPAAVWEMLGGVDAALSASGADIDYDIDQNSNSYVRSALYSVGIDLDRYIQDVRPEDVKQFPGAQTNVLLGAKTGPFQSSDDPIPLDLTGDNGGTEADDFIRTGIGDDVIEGARGDDVMEGGGGNDRIDGGDGTDTSIYRGAFGEYTVEYLRDGNTTVTDRIAGRDGTDILVELELARFADRLVDLGGDIPPGDPIALRIGFESEDAGFANAFGIYDKATLNAELLAADLNALAEGAVLHEAEVTRARLDDLGFFLLPNGATENADLASLVGQDLMVVNTADGYAVGANGTPLAGAGAPAFFSDASLNPDGLDHFVEDGAPAAYVLSVEDIAGGGDLDFDDARFRVETSLPITAAEVAGTFESESAGFHNTFGFYIDNTGEAEIVFADLDENTPAPGATEIFSLTADQYKNLQFFRIPDGATENADLFSDLGAIDLVVEEADGALQARDINTGMVLEGPEDRPGASDADHDDAVVDVRITPDAVLV